MKGHIRKDILKDGKTTRYIAIADTGKNADGKRTQKWKSFATRKAAEEYLNHTIGAVRKGTYGEPTKATIKEYMADWLDAGAPGRKSKEGKKASTLASYRAIVERYIGPHLGHMKVIDLAPVVVRAFYDGLAAQGLSTRTIRYAATVLSAALAVAVRDGKLGRNPTDGATVPQLEAKREKKVWTGKQLQDFLAHAKDDPFYAAWHLAASTGMRRGELCGLRWADVDLATGKLTSVVNRVLVRQKDTDGKYRVAVVNSTPKRGKGRTIALDASTVEVLRQHRIRQLAILYKGKDAEGSFDVFMAWDGGELNPDTLSYHFENAVRKSGLPVVTLHTLRHGWATMALEAGVPMKVVQERLGHSSYRVTADIYSHVADRLDRDAAERVAAAFASNIDQTNQTEQAVSSGQQA